jgi:RNA polymerase sigma-70 factor (ECF subfamily)
MIEGVIADVEPQRSSIERAIVERATAGDEIAFARIVAAFHEDLARIAYFVTGDLDVAEEAEQAAWTIAYRRLKDLRDPDRLRPWLMSIAANEARQIARSRRRRRVRELSVADRGRSGDVDHAALIDLANSLARLDERDRTIVGLRFIGGFDAAEIGRAMGMSATGVRVRLHRLLGRLRKDLGDD